MALMASSNDRRRLWLVSLASRNEGEDMELNNCMILAQVGPLSPSRYAAMLLMTARSAGYMAESFP
jgi:hypothetical protein